MDSNPKKPKIADVARQAGVSVATVSKVINGRGGVSEETRQRIERLLGELGYRKPLVATKTSRTIELIVRDVAPNGTFAMIRQTSEYATERSLGITVTCTGRSLDGRSDRHGVDICLRNVIDRNPLGVILLLSDITEEERQLLSSRDIPYVIVDPVGQVSGDTLGVGIDNWTSGLVATEHLIRLGHRRIAVITGPADAQSSQARLSGYAAALRKANIPYDDGLVRPGDYLPDKAYEQACALLDLPEDKRPTAIFAFNDLSAVAVYNAAGRRGITLPGQLSVVGFDDVFPSQYLYPSLTTVTQPFDLMARHAIDLILDARGDRTMDHYRIFPTHLEIRESTAPPHAAV